MHRPLGAQISHMLKDRGVDVIFGIPGVHNQEMYRGIEEAGITHVLARHEQGAGFMADGYARATGRPGVAYVITGPGLCNIMTPMGQAYSDSVPMLVVSSCLDDIEMTRGQLHQMKDQRLAAETVCDWSCEALEAETAYALIDRAWEEFSGPRRKRPKHLQVRISALEALAPPPPSQRAVSAQIDRVAPAQVAEIAAEMMAAKRPVVILGGGASQATEEVRRVLDAAQAASFMTYAGRGIVAAEDHRSFGSFLGRPESASVLQGTDFALILGTELAEVDLWRDHSGCPDGAVVVNIDADVLELCLPSDRRFQMDARAFLLALEAGLTGTPASTWKPAEIAATRSRWKAEVDAERPGIVPVADALRECLPQGAMIYSDMTQFAYAAKEFWDMDRPGHWHHPTGFGTLGYALPAAIGGAVGRPGKPTLAIAGDYGFQYTVQELGTAVELGLPLPIVIWDNGKLGEIEDSMIRAQIAPNAVVQRNPDFGALARAWGAHAAVPESLAAMQQAVREAFSADGPTVIWVRAGAI